MPRIDPDSGPDAVRELAHPLVRTVSVPAGHPYPRAVRASADSWLVIDDPDPDQPDRPARGPWWPHRGLEPDWLDTQDFDLLHVHFGFDHRTPDQLSQLVEFLRATGRPLVLTVHDLRSPHQQDAATLDHQLDVLVPAADALLTLTPWAARQIHRRWGRVAQVVAHPPLVDPASSRRLRAERQDRHSKSGSGVVPVVGLAAKSLRVNCDPVRLLPALEDAARRHGGRLRVTVHAEVLARPGSGSTGDARRRAVQALSEARARGVEVVAHEPWSDAELWAELAGQHVAVLPYRFGTHSGWLEACHDVGTHVVAPDFGGYADQGADAVYAADEDTVDAASLVTAVDTALTSALTGRLAGDAVDAQVARSQAAADAHARVYRSVLAPTLPVSTPTATRTATRTAIR